MARPDLQALVASGAVQIGAEVFHAARRHPERTVKGKIVAKGIEVGGRVYASPSGAARAVTGTAAENGRRWWRLNPGGETLESLRAGAETSPGS